MVGHRGVRDRHEGRTVQRSCPHDGPLCRPRPLDGHYAAARAELSHWRGVEIDTAGDGLLATFDGPARAVRFAFAVRARDRELGLDVRTGVHCGEVERADRAIRGINVNLAARIATAATPGEVLTSNTIRDLIPASGLRF